MKSESKIHHDRKTKVFMLGNVNYTTTTKGVTKIQLNLAMQAYASKCADGGGYLKPDNQGLRPENQQQRVHEVTQCCHVQDFVLKYAYRPKNY